MALTIGQAQTDPVSGMSGAIWTQLKTEIPILGTLPAVQTASARKFCESIATGVINHIISNAVTNESGGGHGTIS